MPKKISPLSNSAPLKQLFGATIRKYRQKLGVSQEELAWRAEMHRTYLADVERGARNLSLSSIARLVNAIGVPLSAFFSTLESVELPNQGSGRKSARTGRARK